MSQISQFASSTEPYASTFTVVDFWLEHGLWHIDCLAATPPPGHASNIIIEVPQTELPDNINQNQLGVLIKDYLGMTVNKTFPPLVQFMNAGTQVTLP